MANRCVHRQIPMAIKSPMPLRLVMEVSSPYPPSSKLHESCPAGLYTGWLQTAVGIDTGCPPGPTIYSGSAPAYNGSLILFLLSQGHNYPQLPMAKSVNELVCRSQFADIFQPERRAV